MAHTITEMKDFWANGTRKQKDDSKRETEEDSDEEEDGKMGGEGDRESDEGDAKAVEQVGIEQDDFFQIPSEPSDVFLSQRVAAFPELGTMMESEESDEEESDEEKEKISSRHPRKDSAISKSSKFSRVGKVEDDRSGSFFKDRKSDYKSHSSRDGDWKRNDNGKGGKEKDFDRRGKDQKRGGRKDPKLHPSWEAKKAKSSIVQFQGEKITFSD